MEKHIELIVGKPIEEIEYKNTYELRVEYIHGDADGDSENVYHYEQGVQHEVDVKYTQ